MTFSYVDTSVLAKRYLNEPRSDEVDAYLGRQSHLLITSLTTVEMRSMIARRRREGELDAALEMQIFAAFRDDVQQRYFDERELGVDTFESAVHVIAQLQGIPLRTLDALHLAAAQQLGSERLATADYHMRDAAVELEIPVDFFG